MVATQLRSFPGTQLSEDLISMLNADGRASRSPTRAGIVREESPVPVPVQPVPLGHVVQPVPAFSAEPVARTAPAPFDRQAITPPLAPRPLTSVVAGTPGAGRMGKPFQRLVVHTTSMGQLPGQVPSLHSSGKVTSLCFCLGFHARCSAKLGLLALLRLAPLRRTQALAT